MTAGCFDKLSSITHAYVILTDHGSGTAFYQISVDHEIIKPDNQALRFPISNVLIADAQPAFFTHFGTIVHSAGHWVLLHTDQISH